MVLEKTLESPLDCKEIKPVQPKGDQSWVFIGRTDVGSWNSNTWPSDVKSWLIGKDPVAGKDWGQEKKWTLEDEMAGWPNRLNGHEFGWTPRLGDGHGGLSCCSSWGHNELETTERLNWTELNKYLGGKSFSILRLPYKWLEVGRVEERRWVWAGEGVSGLLTTGWLASLRSSTRCRPPVSRPRGWAGWRPSCPGQEEARQRGPGSGRGSPTVKACCGHLLPLSFSLSWDSHGRAWKIIISLKKKIIISLEKTKGVLRWCLRW